MPDRKRRDCSFLLPALVGLLHALGNATRATDEAAIRAPDAAPVINVKPADAFMNSVGVNVHLGYVDTVYGQYENLIRPRLKELGVRHLRDGIQRNNPEFYVRVRELAAMGLRFTLVAPPEIIQSPEEFRAGIEAAGPAVIQVEGPNELDTTGPGWEERVRRLQRSLYRMVQENPEWAHLTVAGASMANTFDSPARLGRLGAFLDCGNVHNYPGGVHVGAPGRDGWRTTFEQGVAEERKVCQKKPIVATETGYHNNVLRGLHPGVSEAAACKLIPRLLCYHFGHGIVRTYLYEFADETRDRLMTTMEAHFGLIRYDGSPKPAFVAVKNLLALLADPGPAFAPGELQLTLGGETADVCVLALAKRDGRFDVLVWQEVASFDTTARADLAVPTKLVKLKLGRKFARAAEFRPSDRIDRPLRVSEGVEALEVAVPDEVIVVELTP